MIGGGNDMRVLVGQNYITHLTNKSSKSHEFTSSVTVGAYKWITIGNCTPNVLQPVSEYNLNM